MKEYYIKPEKLDSDSAVQDYFEKLLELPRYYGRNLDALYDVLTDICEETVFLVKCQNEENLPESAGKMLRVLRDAAKHNVNISIRQILV